jgi:HSP20 family protein
MLERVPYLTSTRRGYNPFRDMENLEKAFFGGDRRAPFAADIRDTGDAFLMEADLPGFKKEDIHVDVDGNRLTISAERNNEDKEEQDGYIRRERSYGSYCRTFDISEIVADEITADYTDGVLTLNLPKAQPKQPTARRIELK